MEFGFQSAGGGVSAGLIYMGTWDALTNTPTLASGVGTSGQYYIVSVDGTTNLDGITDWMVGDWAIFSGTAWQKIDNSDIVGIQDLNGLTFNTQTFATGTSGSDFNISSVSTTHTFNLPDASATTRGALTSTDWTTFNSKVGGSGTTNYISKFTGSGTLGDSVIYESSSNIGIGTITPLSKLSILQNTVSTGAKGLSVNFNTIGEVFYIDDNGYLVYNANAGATFKGSNGIINIISNGGTSPTLNFKYNNGGSDSGSLYGNSASMFLQSPLFGIGNINFTPSASTHIQGIDSTSSNYALKVDNSASSPLFYFRNDGNLKITPMGSGTAAIEINTQSTQDSKIYFSTNNSATIRGRIYLEDSTQTFNFYTLNNDTIFWNGNGLAQDKTLTLFTNTSAKFESNVGIAVNVDSTSRLKIKGIDSTSSNFALKIDNSSSSALFYVRNDGYTELNGDFSIVDKNIIFGTTTGTKIGTSTTQKLAFYNATPIIQPSAVTTPQEIATALSNLGLLAVSTINSITLTTTGSSGVATYTQATNTLNIPDYSAGSGGGAASSLFNYYNFI